MAKIKKKLAKKRFHPKRQFRLSDKNYNWLKEIKTGTWNYTITKIKILWEERRLRK